MLAVQRHCLPATGCLAVTMIEDYLGCPFDQEKLPGGSIFVQGCHKAVFRFERDFVDPRIGGLLRLPFETELVAERIESPPVGSPSTFQAPSSRRISASLQ